MEETKILEKFLEINGIVQSPQIYWPNFPPSTTSEGRSIEVEKNGQLLYVNRERGKEFSKEYAIDLTDLMYRIFRDVTFDMSSEYTAKHPIINEDSRRQLFAHQEELLGKVSHEWENRCKKEHLWILRYRPFDDMARNRADLTIKLTTEGRDPTDAWHDALKKYPLPHKG